MASSPDRPALSALRRIPSVALGHYPSPIEEMGRLRETLGGGPRLLVKRDDAIAFGFGGNKVRKIEMVAARALADGADMLITTGGVQSNHCRVTAAAAARLGMRCVIVASGAQPARLSANALLDALFGAEIVYVGSRDERSPAMERAAAEARARGGRPFVIPLGASTPLGALGFARAVGEMIEQMTPQAGRLRPSGFGGQGRLRRHAAGLRHPFPDFIFHSTSSGGTQAGLVAGCAMHGLPTRVIGISADETAAGLQSTVGAIVRGMGDLLGVDGAALAAARPIEADDRFVGAGYGMPTDASREAQALVARTEALVVDHTYTAKALAGMIGWIREGRVPADATALFWHTGGQVGIFAL